MKATLVALTAVALYAAPSADAAGTGSIEGTVVDAQSSQIIPGGKIAVSVACGSVRRAAAVDDAGHFAIGGLPEGACSLTASGTAYVATNVAVAVTAGSIATVLVSVTARAYLSRGNPGAEPPGVRKQQEAQMKILRKHRRPPAVNGAMGRAGAGAMPIEADEDRGAAFDMARAERAQPVPPPEPAPPPMLAPPRDRKSVV